MVRIKMVHDKVQISLSFTAFIWNTFQCGKY